MRTYSKKNKYKKVELKTCRCCVKTTENAVLISDPNNQFLLDLLSMLLENNVLISDELPGTICEDCFLFFKQLDVFRKRCQASVEWLKSNAPRDESSIPAVKSGEESVVNIKTKRIESKEIKISHSQISKDWEEIGSTVNQNFKTDSVLEHNEFTPQPFDIVIQDVTEAIKTNDKLNTKIKKEVLSNSPKSKTRNLNPKKRNFHETVCPLCQRNFATRQSMLRHLAKEKGAKNHVCQICGMRFAQSITLQNHIMTHTNTKPFKCNFCNKRFIQKCNLREHIRVHMGKDFLAYQCDQCPRTFKFASGLSRHYLIHKGINYKCEVCGKLSNDYSSAKRHMKKHIRDTVPKIEEESQGNIV